ncbi:MAG: efflux RND transporter permease subunit [Thermodesulfovibrionales bacterium]
MISKLANEYVENKRALIPGSLSISIWNDTTELFNSRMSLLKRNARIGLMLVIIILGLFLEIRLASWVMLGIPISFMGALLFMPILDVSINMISLFAFILTLGILVDDAIIVGENIYSHRLLNKPYEKAAVDGALEVTVPVTFSILTTIIAFLPLVFISGIMGKFIRVIPLIVISLLAVSLIESLFVLPAHLSMGRPRKFKGRILGTVNRIQSWVSNKLEDFIEGPFSKVLDLSLKNRYTTLAIGIAALLITIGIIGGGILKFNFMPVVDGDVINAKLKMPPGTPVHETAKVQKYLETKAMEVLEEYDSDQPDGRSILRNVYSVVGSTVLPEGMGGAPQESSAHLSGTAIFLIQGEERGIPAKDIASRWKERVGEIPGIESLAIESNLVMMGANIDIQIENENFEISERVAEKIKTALANYPGVSDITDNFSRGKKELKIRLKPEARTIGITEEDLGRQIRGAFYGAEALRIQRGRNEVKVMVRYPEHSRKNLWDLESMRIRTPNGGEVPLNRAAYVSEGFGYSEINRTDRKRVINVTASVDDNVANTGEILADLNKGVLKELKEYYPGLILVMGGEQKESNESMESMRRGYFLALIGIYALLAIPFRSYSQPLLIMTAIPFGLVGAAFGHLIMGFNLSILSMFGLVALSGVVVNDSLLLIDKVNRNRRKGAGMFDAARDASKRRFRPIMLTSLTTFFGLSPMITETSVQAQFLIPMALSLGFGILFATGITLVLIPSLYLILEDIRRVFKLHSFEESYDEHYESEKE